MQGTAREREKERSGRGRKGRSAQGQDCTHMYEGTSHTPRSGGVGAVCAGAAATLSVARPVDQRSVMMLITAVVGRSAAELHHDCPEKGHSSKSSTMQGTAKCDLDICDANIPPQQQVRRAPTPQIRDRRVKNLGRAAGPNPQARKRRGAASNGTVECGRWLAAWVKSKISQENI